MIEWTSKSDRSCEFYVGNLGAANATTFQILSEMLQFLVTNLFGNQNASNFECLLLEVNCDSGRVLVGVTTWEGFARGRTDGCTFRIQALQDFWYQLLARCASDEEFSKGIDAKVNELGTIFGDHVTERIDTILKHSAPDGFTFITFGLEPGVEVLRRQFKNVTSDQVTQ